MPLLYVATSKTQQEWAADVGLGKHVYKVGLAPDGQTPQELLDGHAGQTDWKILRSQPVQDRSEEDLLQKLARKEKMVDPAYYPKLRGATGVVKVNLAAVENAAVVAQALEGKDPPKGMKIKPTDIADYLIRNAL